MSSRARGTALTDHTPAARRSGLGTVFQGFKAFITRGNVVDLAVGIAIGAAFGAVVTALNKGLIGPLVAWVLRGEDLSKSLSWYWGKTFFSVGLVLDALLTFVITAAAIYFLVVVPMNRMAERRKRGVEAEPTAPAEDVLLLQEIRDLLARQPSPAIVNDLATPAAPLSAPASGLSAPLSDPLPPSIPPGT